MNIDWDEIDRRIMGEAWVGSRLKDHLTELCTRIGPRWASTPGEHQAAHYIKGQMDRAGLTQTDLEEFDLDTWDHEPAEAHIPEDERPVALLPLLNCPPIDLRAPLVHAGFGMPHELAPLADRLSGSIAVLDLATEPFSPPRILPDRLLDLSAAGAVAAVVVDEKSGGRMEYHRTTDKRRAQRVGQVLPHPLPTVLTSREDGVVLRLAAAEEKSLAIRLKTRSYRAGAFNTAAELPGAVWPDEALVLGAHHDTYPASPGGNDNASGTVVVLDVARVLAQLCREGAAPGRAIRFCTWSGEEQNFQGSAAYVRRHHGPEPLPRLVVNLDEIGAGPIKGVVLQFPELRPLLQRTLDSLDDGLQCHVLDRLDHSNDGYSFACRGIPYAILWRWRFVGRHADADYRGEPGDTADKVRPRELKEYVGQLARLLLRLSHIPPQDWPENTLDVDEIKDRLKREVGTTMRTM